MARKFFVGGNFKMNGSLSSTKQLVEILNKADLDPNAEVVIAPPTIYLLLVQELAKNGVKVAAQNAYLKPSGAFTGEISPAQLVDAKIDWVILGHSERRTLFGDTSELVGQKTKAALGAGLNVILCVGETLEERDSGKTAAVVEAQLEAVVKEIGKAPEQWAKIVIAYEPVWAIGTGKVATTAQAQETHHETRAYLSKNVSQDIATSTRILYGGSVNAANSVELAQQPDVDGFLVGGASLKPEFVDIINSTRAK